MNENVVLPNISLVSQHSTDVYSEISFLRESVKEAVSEAKQSSVFCQKIQRDISTFVESEKNSRSNDTPSNMNAILLSTMSIMERLSSFENYVLGKVREEVHGISQTLPVKVSGTYPDESRGSMISTNEETIVKRIKKLENQQEELDGKFQALVSDSVYVQGTLRSEINSCVAKVRARIISLQEEMEIIAAAAERHAAQSRESAAIPAYLRELLTLFAALQAALEDERRAHEEERSRAVALMERMLDKIKSLEAHSAAAAAAGAAGAGVGAGAAGVGVGVAPPPGRAAPRAERELHELSRDLRSAAGAVERLRVQHDEQQCALEQNAAEIAALRQAIEKLSVKESCTANAKGLPPVEKSREDLPVWLCEDVYACEAREPTRRNSRVANMLNIQTTFRCRSCAFQTWLTWTRGRVQLNKDKMILSLFTKQRKQLEDITRQVHEMSDSKKEAEEEEPVKKVITRELFLAISNVQRNWASVLSVLHLLRPWVRHVEYELEGARRRDLPVRRAFTKSTRVPRSQSPK